MRNRLRRLHPSSLILPPLLSLSLSLSLFFSACVFLGVMCRFNLPLILLNLITEEEEAYMWTFMKDRSNYGHMVPDRPLR